MRRSAPAFLVLIGLLSTAASAGAAVHGFRFGVAAGEVRDDSARIWGAAKGSGRVLAEVATDRRFRHLVETKSVRAADSNDGTVQAKVKGLEADEVHFYRFCAVRSPCGETGQFVTAPEPSADETIEFAWSADTDGTRERGAKKPFFGTFKVFDRMQRESNDFNVHLGDTIYSDSGVAGKPARTVKAKWGRYRENLAQRNLTDLRGSAGFYSHWDDHEFINDFSIPEDGRKLYEAGVEAFRDYAPVTYSRQRGLYRSFRWGANLEVFFLDERSFRDAKASANGVCDNPETGEPDLAPTAPQDTRNFFSLLIPSLSQPVSQQCLDKINDPDRTFLGQTQYQRFIEAVDDSSARWKVVMNETPIQQFYGLPYDRWEGYAFERVRLLNDLAGREIDNVVFLTTDTHAAFANVIRLRTLEGDAAPSNAPAGPMDTAYQDFIIGPVATNPFWPEIDSVTGQEGSGQLLSQLFFKPPPPDGVGMFCAQGDVLSYGQVEVSSSQLRISYKDERGQTVKDVDGETDCGPYVLNAQ